MSHSQQFYLWQELGGKELKGGGIKDLAFCPEFPLHLSKVKPSIERLNIFSYYQNAEDFDSKEDYKWEIDYF